MCVFVGGLVILMWEADNLRSRDLSFIVPLISTVLMVLSSSSSNVYQANNLLILIYQSCLGITSSVYITAERNCK